jgi:hypothetical protein
MITEEYLFGIISRFPRTADELIAERVGITNLSRACGNDENFFAHAFSLFCSVQSAGMNYPGFSFAQKILSGRNAARFSFLELSGTKQAYNLEPTPSQEFFMDIFMRSITQN